MCVRAHIIFGAPPPPHENIGSAPLKTYTWELATYFLLPFMNQQLSRVFYMEINHRKFEQNWARIQESGFLEF